MPLISGPEKLLPDIKKQVPTLNSRAFLTALPGLLKTPIPALVNLSSTHGDILKISAGPFQVFTLINDPDLAREVLKNSNGVYNRRKILYALKDFLGEGIFRARPQAWQESRSRMKPAFHEQAIRQYESVMQEEIEAFIHQANQRIRENQRFQMEAPFDTLSLRILFRAHFFEEFFPDEQTLIHQLHDILFSASLTAQKSQYVKNWARQLVGKPAVPPARSVKALREVDKLVEELIGRATEEPDKAGYLLKRLLAAWKAGQIPQSLVRDELMNFLFAGWDTVGVALSWGVYCLASHPEIQEKARKESITLGQDLNMASLGELKYTRMVVQEVLRLYPSVWAIFRVTDADLRLGDYHIPEKTHVLISPPVMHRNATWWEQPEAFKPERFAPENRSFKGQAYVPFGSGPTLCIGSRMAMTEIQLALAFLLRHFRFKLSSAETPRILPEIIIKTAKPLPVAWIPISSSTF
ncbi:MAG: cytochrome P450 [Bacteroidota bacterium]